MRVLFVCTANICRSPTAVGVMRHMVREAGLQNRISADSAGTHGFHAGEAIDKRAQAHAARRGYDLSSLKARAIGLADYRNFDLIIAMDRSHLQQLRHECPPEERHKLHLFTEYSGGTARDVPDPYHGGSEGFERVLDLVESGVRGLLAEIKKHQA